MIETVDGSNTVVQNYTSSVDIKEYIQEVLVPNAYPNIPMNKLNLGLIGIVSEMIGQVVEDAHGTATLMMNEAFITKAVLPSSIYANAALYDLGYRFATPSRCNFALEIWLDDIIQYSTDVRNTNTKRYKVDKDTKLILGNNIYKLDYDIIIDHQLIDGKRVFNIYYDMEEANSISGITNKYVKHQVTSIGWLVLFIELKEFDRKTDTVTISDNIITTNSPIEISWSGQIAGLDLVYITPQGSRQAMKLRNQYTAAEIDPFAWYIFKDDNRINLMFSSNSGYFNPAFNSKIEYTVYTCRGSAANFDEYDRKAGVPVQRTGDRFEYNADTRMVALCYGGSVGGLDRGDLETLRNDVILAHNTSNVLCTDHDLQMWFNTYAKRYGTKAEFFKRRDDPSGKLFSQFIAITNNDNYVYPTNTLSIRVTQDQFDFVNNDAAGVNNEFIIKPGHLWEYDDINDTLSRDTVRMVYGIDGKPAMVTDESLPPITSARSFIFTNPFYIKIHRDPTISANYNCLVDHTSWPEDVPVNTGCFYQFQLATFSIERSLSRKYSNKYHIEVICVPVVTTDTTLKYVEGIGSEFPKEMNNLRLVLVTRSAKDGETGYIEMTPTELRNGGSILFECEFSVYDNITDNMQLEIDLENSIGMRSLMSNGDNDGKIFIDTSETSFHIIVMMKDFANKLTTTLYGDSSFDGYTMANRFANDNRELELYKPMSMMRSVINFEGQNDDYTITASLIPFLKYDIPLDDSKMLYFIRAFDEQYTAMEPVLSKLDGNSAIDFKLYNTYGRSSNYYIGPKDGSESLRDSDILLDSVYVNIKLKISVYDRSIYSQTAESVINEIKLFFDSLNNGERTDIHVSDIIHTVLENQPNVRYIRFIGFSDYDANKQSIFVKYTNMSDLPQNQLYTYVPEMIRVDSDSIEISEEV